MTGIKNHLVVGGTLVALATIGTLMEGSNNRAQGASGPAVTVVSGNVAATQSGPWSMTANQGGSWNMTANQGGSWNMTANQGGTWNVGITGQPVSVNAHITDASIPISIGTSAPLLFKNVEEPGRVPYQEMQQGVVTCSGVCGTEFTFGTVPAGQRLVITNVNSSLQMPTGGTFISALLSGRISYPGQTGNSLQQLLLPMQLQYRNGLDTVGSDFWAIQEHVLLYVDAGFAPTIGFGSDPGHAPTGVQYATLTGYFVSVP